MTKLATALSGKKLSLVAKMLAVLDSLGGSAKTGAIKQTASANGARRAASWNVAASFNPVGERVARVGDAWLLLDDGRTYLRNAGYEPDSASAPSAPGGGAASLTMDIAIGHGHSTVWKDLRDFLQEGYEARVIEFNSTSVVGLANKERLEQLLKQASLAFLVMTAEDDRGDGKRYPRLNVVHEAGLFQGRLGFDKAAILLEDGCEEFSNIAGLGQIKFRPGEISSALEDVRKFLKAAGVKARD